MNIHQFAAGFQLGDAISQEMLELKRLLDLQGYKGTIFAENVFSFDKKYANKIGSAKVKKDDILIYHHSIHSEVLEFILKFPNKKILIYHNVTPEEYFLPYDLKFSYLLRMGREDLKIINQNFDHFFAVSNFNLQELHENGFFNPKLLPLHLNFSKWNHLIPKRIKSPKDRLNLLFVGRIAPNKRQDDLIRFIRVWKDKYNVSIKLRMIGFCNPNQESYLEELRFMIHHLDLLNEVEILPYVNDSLLTQYYLDSDFFVSMSEHEGFCVPLMEAMFFGLPVFAYAAGAVEETLDGSGLLFKEKNFDLLCSELYSITQDPKKLEQILDGQFDRLERFRSKSNIENLLEAIQS